MIFFLQSQSYIDFNKLAIKSLQKYKKQAKFLKIDLEDSQ